MVNKDSDYHYYYRYYYYYHNASGYTGVFVGGVRLFFVLAVLSRKVKTRFS